MGDPICMPALTTPLCKNFVCFSLNIWHVLQFPAYHYYTNWVIKNILAFKFKYNHNHNPCTLCNCKWTNEFPDWAPNWNAGFENCRAKGQTNSKWFFSADVSSKKTNEQIQLYYLLACFCSFFERKWRHQKVISKLTDIY